MANDLIAYDEIDSYDIVNVYVPFVNINNFVYDLFGEFEFKHNSMAMLQALFHQKSNKTICYAHVSRKFMELAILEERRLVLYNQFDYKTKEEEQQKRNSPLFLTMVMVAIQP